MKKNGRLWLVEGVVGVVFLLVLCVSVTEAKTIYVNISNASGVEDGTAVNPFKTIQKGVNAAVNDDTVRVAPGLYNENVTISGKGIRLIGENPATTSIQGSTSTILLSGTFSPDFPTVEIANFTISGGANTAGVKSGSASSSAVIHNCIILGNNRGVETSTAGATATVYNCTIVQNSTGTYVYGSSSITISNSIIYQNSVYGIDSYSGTTSSVFNNLFANGTEYRSGGTIVKSGDKSVDPQFLANYQLAAASPSIDAGRPTAVDNDPDGTRNNQGAYGGPGAAAFWPGTAGGPVVTTMSVTPSVPVGGTITLKATGKVR